MVSPHFDVRVLSRGSGNSAVMAAAYHHRSKMYFEREARLVDYSGKQDLIHEEFVVPTDAPEWIRKMIADHSPLSLSETFWNRLENFEKKLDAQLATDVTLALPVELSFTQNIALVRDFVEQFVLAKGMVADWVYHDAPGNPHVHLMKTLRPLSSTGFGSKRVKVLLADGSPKRNRHGRIVYMVWSRPREFNAFRDGWFACQNSHLAVAGLDVRIDGRSYESQGIDLEPIIRFSATTKAIERRIEEGTLTGNRKPKSLELQSERRTENARRIQSRPELVLDLISRQKSVFDERDVARVLDRYFTDVALLKPLLARILQSPEALRLERERIDFATGIRVPDKYTTRELIRLEAEMVTRAVWLSGRSTHGVGERVRNLITARHTLLSQEQLAALAGVTDTGRMAVIIGRAGAGKTTLMNAARETWEMAGYQVLGAALAGKAAEALSMESGIRSRTLSAWEQLWSEGRRTLNARTIFVLDEAGMVSSRQMALLVEAVTKAGAKLVLVGDPDQLQPIEAGAALRSIADRIGYAELETIYRQREDWMRSASIALARGRVADALHAYGSNDNLIASERKTDAVDRLIADWDRDYDPNRTTVILAHLRRDVRMLNEKARAKLIERGVIKGGHAFATMDGKRHFAAGDQIVFLKNEGMLGVKNGTIGRVLDASINRIVVEVGKGEGFREVAIESSFYSSVDHGYATTIHKSQGATVDSVKMLASLSLDRHLTYVAMTRHRESLAIYYGRRSFENAGGLVSIMSRSDVKETTLDYSQSSFYRQALRFAGTRGFHLIAVARTIVRDRLDWIVRQKERLSNLVERFTRIGRRLEQARSVLLSSVPKPVDKNRPMVAGVATFINSFEQAIEERLEGDAGLTDQWQKVSFRFHLVYQDAQAAFREIDVDRMLKNHEEAKVTIDQIAREPERFGALKGKTGLFVWKADQVDRERALVNAPMLGRDLERYLQMRALAVTRCQEEERILREKASIDVPDLSANARQVLESVRNALERSDRTGALDLMHGNSEVTTELRAFSKTVADRFGERTFLGNAASDAGGATFDKVARGMTFTQKAELRSAWGLLRTAQQLAAQERTTLAITQAETLRNTKSRGLSLT
ncbi:Ti-type conjugative transfer relaxase TraA [Ensifer sp.]|uniref:Ti-type conjugative transfer relaxase TraA n=1 Tax=Ensifer sp. TaxID=1872086 RepID=UPI00289A78CA|nr:Ti-type conjugative transfer relaxase TraA [Ensifer sp.]